MKEVPDLEPGQVVRVHLKVVEGEKERVQRFEGLIIALRGSEVRRPMTVRPREECQGIPNRRKAQSLRILHCGNWCKLLSGRWLLPCLFAPFWWKVFIFLLVP
ncbi:MAG: 50S ribosomal protein L19 [Candidatus Atribacteria bacterium]|nr:50S ribosomal protein L19 [Candidatus Atribacteria bacterium]